MKPAGTKAVVLWLFTVSLSLCCCARGQPELFLQPIEKDVELGQQLSERVVSEIGLIDDPFLRAYLQQVGQRVVTHIDDKRFQYHFEVIDQIEPNAFAAPGGFVYVSRGLLPLLQSEDELANVLSHEIVHVARRHTAKQMAKQTLPNLLSIPGQMVGWVVGSDLGKLINLPVDTVGAVFLTAYSRQDELEADEVGQGFSAAAGYDPGALATILKRLEQEEHQRTGQHRRASFFDTHPTTPQRSRNIARRAETVPWQREPQVAGERFLYQLEGLLIGENPALGVFRGQQFMHPHLDMSIQFPDGWSTANSPYAVIAVSAERDALMLLGVHGEGSDPKAVGDEFVKKIEEEIEVEPPEPDELQVGDSSAYRLTFVDTANRKPVYLEFLWIAHHNLIYQITGLASEDSRSALRDAALSFRSLTPDERQNIFETRLRVVAADGGEDIGQLSSRTGNVWGLETTALINDLQVNEPLHDGQLIKIALSKAYDQ